MHPPLLRVNKASEVRHNAYINVKKMEFALILKLMYKRKNSTSELFKIKTVQFCVSLVNLLSMRNRTGDRIISGFVLCQHTFKISLMFTLF